MQLDKVADFVYAWLEQPATREEVIDILVGPVLGERAKVEPLACKAIEQLIKRNRIA